jgi:type III protein arginine methyltransferase
MTDWADRLDAALASGEPDYMKAMLEQVPLDVLQRAAPHLEQAARLSEREGRPEQALTYLDQLVRIDPGSARVHALRAGVHSLLGRHADALTDAERVVVLMPDAADGHRLQGDIYQSMGETSQAVSAYRHAAQLAPADGELSARIGELESQLLGEALRESAADAADRTAGESSAAKPPETCFDPALLDDPSFPPDLDPLRITGVLAHLRRYSGQQSPREALSRLEDPRWLAAWDTALLRCAGKRVRLHGSELGVFALRALRHGALHVRCVERCPLDARITLGMAQKHFLPSWHALHGEAVRSWSEDECRASFEAHTGAIDVVLDDADGTDGGDAADVLIFPRIDHTLLGTGIVAAVRRHLASSGVAPRVVPARAEIYAVGIEWRYPAAGFDLQALDRFRWSPYPQPLELDGSFWTARTATVRVGSIDFARFEETTTEFDLPVVSDGRVDALMFWFELDLGGVVIRSAPSAARGCIRPAVQYTDPMAVHRGCPLRVSVSIDETRLYLRSRPPPRLQRSHRLPSWYIPMLGDARRNDGYAAAIAGSLASQATHRVLDIGAGCGLLSMIAARAGAPCVIGCESQAELYEAGREIVQRNGLTDRITLVHRDVRGLCAEDIGGRADLALFELFDCSLIGEGVLHLVAHAREHLLSANARYLPAGARLRGQLIECRIERLLDVEASLLNPYRFSPGFINVDARGLKYRAMSAPFDLFEFDFAAAGPVADERTIDARLSRDGIVGAMLFWFDLRLDDSTWLSNAPDSAPLHWKQGLQWLPEVRAEAGTLLPLVAGHDGSALCFKWRDGAIAQESLLRLPRFDPRWLAASTQLEQQTAGLLEHCRQTPQELSTVAAIAQRVAVDPARHGIDPVIAQRFAALLSGG